MEKGAERGGLWGKEVGDDGGLDAVLVGNVDRGAVERKVVGLVNMEKGTGRGAEGRRNDQLGDVIWQEIPAAREDPTRPKVPSVKIAGPTERREMTETVGDKGKDLEAPDLNRALGATKPHAPGVDIGKYASRDKPRTRVEKNGSEKNDRYGRGGGSGSGKGGGGTRVVQDF